MPQACVMCGAPSQSTCVTCRAAAYCSRSCQKSHWPAHKRVCGRHGIARQYKGRESFSVCVFWESPDGAVIFFPLALHRDDTVDELKQRIFAERGVPVDDQTLKARLRTTASYAVMRMGWSTWRDQGTATGTVADYEIDADEMVCLVTSRTVAPRPTCRTCLVCIDNACSLQSFQYPRGPPDAPRNAPPPNVPRHARPPGLSEPARNGPCPCGSGKKYKKCCGK